MHHLAGGFQGTACCLHAYVGAYQIACTVTAYHTGDQDNSLQRPDVCLVLFLRHRKNEECLGEVSRYVPQ